MMRRPALGVTMTEMMLVLVLVTAILVLGLRFYQSLRIDSDTATLRYNVDTIMQSMLRYYRANCNGVAGTLSPLNPAAIFNAPFPPAAESATFVMATLANGYLDVNRVAYVPFVNSAPPLILQGYQAQFIPIVVPTAALGAYDPTATGADSIRGGVFANAAMQTQAIFWIPQVKVLLRPQQQNRALMLNSILNGDGCITAIPSWAAGPCNANSVGIIVSGRFPNTFSRNIMPDFTPLQPMMDNFRASNAGYNPVVGFVMPTGTQDVNAMQQQYYYCGQ